MKLPWSFLERSKGYLLPMFDQHGTEDKEKRLHYCKKHSKTIVHFQILVLVTFFAPGPCLHFLVRCPWSLVFGPWALVPGSCCLVLGPSVFDPWLLAPASCSLVLGPWRLLPGPCCLVLGAWSVVPGPWSLVLGLWCLVPGVWSLAVGPWFAAVRGFCGIHDVRAQDW